MKEIFVSAAITPSRPLEYAMDESFLGTELGLGVD
jgi:hypothetical protein